MSPFDDGSANQVPPEKSVTLNLYFYQRGKETGHVFVDTADGSRVVIDGGLYPHQLHLVDEVVQSLRERKDTYPVRRGGVQS